MKEKVVDYVGLLSIYLKRWRGGEVGSGELF
jgi:hypothetical protein